MTKFIILKNDKENSFKQNNKGFSTKNKRFKKQDDGFSTVSVISFTSTNGDDTFDKMDQDHEVTTNGKYLSKARMSSMSLQLSLPLDAFHHSPKVVIFDMIHVPYIDGKGVTTLQEIAEQLEQKTGAHLLLATVSPLVMDTFQRTAFLEAFDRKRLFLTLADAVAHVKNSKTTVEDF